MSSFDFVRNTLGFKDLIYTMNNSFTFMNGNVSIDIQKTIWESKQFIEQKDLHNFPRTHDLSVSPW